MSKHYFKESTNEVEDSQFYRIIFCEWCGVVVWNFSNREESVQLLQKNAKTSCNANTNVLYERGAGENK